MCALERVVVQGVVPLELVEAGEQAASAVERCVAANGSIVKCLLLASSFYEALKAELQRTDRVDCQKNAILAAAAEQCSLTAFASISPEAVLNELRAALALLRTAELKAPPVAPDGRPYRQRTTALPVLTVIKGGLS